MEVLVFKTNVSKQIQVEKVEALLNTIPAISRWNFDLEDCDHILKIVADNLSPRAVEAELKRQGIRCRELK